MFFPYVSIVFVLTKTAVSRAALLTPVCTKSFVGWGFAQTPLYLVVGLLLEREEGRESRRGAEKGRGGKGVRPLPYEEKEKVGTYEHCN